MLINVVLISFDSQLYLWRPVFLESFFFTSRRVWARSLVFVLLLWCTKGMRRGGGGSSTAILVIAADGHLVLGARGHNNVTLIFGRN